MTYYEQLGVSKNATQAEIKHAYKRLASRYHPDRKGGNVVKFQIIQRAYDTLSDEAMRENYDKFGAEPGMAPVRSRAMQTLAATLSSAISDQKWNFDQEHLIKVVREAVVNAQQSLPEQLTKLDKSIQRFERARKRLRAKKGKENMLGSMLETQIKNLKLGRNMMLSEREVGEEMLKILDEYEYDTDAEQPSPFGGIMGALYSNQ